MRNRRSPLIEQIQSFQATSRSPVRRDRRSLTSPSTSSSTPMSVSGWSPRARGHHRRGRSMSSDHSISFVPAASGCSASPTTTPSAVVRRRTVRAVSLSRRAARRRWARVSSASRHSTRNRSSLTGPVSYTTTGRHRPPGVPGPVDGLGVLEQPGDVAPAARPPLGVAGHLDGQHVVVAEAAERGDVEAVGEEVALGVAEVGAVEPDVGLVEDAVERDPPAGARRRRRQLEARAVEDRAVAGGQLGVGPPVAGHGDVEPAAVVDVEADAGPAQLVVGCARSPRARQFHGAAG